MTDRRFIEDSFPVKEVGDISAKEKNIRRGHISTLHIWWARRPLAASRSTIYASLIPTDLDIVNWQNIQSFIIELSKWENSNNLPLIEKARKDILDANGGIPPKILDPFAGGGSYPLEALRLGCEVFSNDYNPVAALIEKATLEYPQKFNAIFDNLPYWASHANSNRKLYEDSKSLQISLLDNSIDLNINSNVNPLYNSVKYWGEWLLNEAKNKLSNFFPCDPDGSIPIGYIWSRAILCQNPQCGVEIPLFRQFWLSKKKNNRVSLYPVISENMVKFKIISDSDGTWVKGFNPDEGTVRKAIATCPRCGSIIDANTTRGLFNSGKSSQIPIAVVLSSKNGSTKKFRLINENDLTIINSAQEKLKIERARLQEIWGFEPVPNEIILTPDGEEFHDGGLNWCFSPVMLYGMTKWGDLFNDRQNLSFIVIADLIRDVYKEILEQTNNTEFAKAIVTYLSFILSRLPDTNSTLCHWDSSWEKTATTFGRQALSMNWDYIEANVLGDKGYNIKNILNSILFVLEKFPLNVPITPVLSQSSATKLPYSDNFFDAIFTDPPYYDNIPYSILSDFFYVWLKRSLIDVHPELFSTSLTPKTNEIISDLPLIRGMNKQLAKKKIHNLKGSSEFEELLSASFKEISRVLKYNGIATIVYAHKSLDGWETVVNALLNSGLVVTGAWPINTEQKSRLRASDSAALASSIYIVARKIPRKKTSFFNDLKIELVGHLNSKLQRLWDEGIGGADFFISAIGSAIEVFGKYEQILDYEGNVVRANRLLQEVRTIATDYAVRQILHNGFASEISDLSRFYVLWRWNYGEALVPFDEARKLGQSCGVDVSLLWGKNSFIKKEKEFIKLLGPQNRKLSDLDYPSDLIDVLHKSLLLWEKGKKTEMIQVLSEKGFGKSEAFYRVAQAISETLPLDSKEKKLLDGFLVGKDRVQSEIEKIETQGRLFK